MASGGLSGDAGIMKFCPQLAGVRNATESTWASAEAGSQKVCDAQFKHCPERPLVGGQQHHALSHSRNHNLNPA